MTKCVSGKECFIGLRVFGESGIAVCQIGVGVNHFDAAESYGVGSAYEILHSTAFTTTAARSNYCGGKQQRC